MDRKFKNAVQEQGLERTGRFYGLYQGLVIENNDPEKRGRLKVKIPSVLGDQVFEKWIYGKSIFNGNNIGIFAIPSVGSGVWITFINGDSSMPIWEMGWFSDKEIPEEFKERYLDGITLKNDRIFIQSKEASIELFENGDIEIDGKGKITINAFSDIDLKSTSGRIGVKNTALSLAQILQELMIVLTTFKVAVGTTPLNTNVFADTQTAITQLSSKIAVLLK
ncbi:phage baseplate assembly protein V [Bernardetia sp. OM2101]|uniref:phage baseplate assembly protein V n=1 Tax=Bernardetia sp. OM2101 TaxID=3344876 RepID=UPI0035D0A392